MVVDLPHPTEGSVRTLGSPLKLSGTPPTLRHASPTHGQDTAHILAAMGLGNEEIARLREQGAIRG
jgi:formyl-CoA transferase/CoA:oxalate CoA-transferase